MKLHGIYSNYLYCLKVFLKFHRVVFSHFVLWESIHPSTDIWAASTFWLLCIMLLWTARFKSAFNEEYIPRSGIAGAYGNLCKFLEELPHYLPQQLHHLTFLPAVHKRPVSPHPTNIFFQRFGKKKKRMNYIVSQEPWEIQLSPE